MAAAAAFAVVTSLFTPWATSPADAAVGQGFNPNLSDVRFILKQIKIAEAHAASATSANPCGTLLGTGVNQIPNGNQQGVELPWGLRTVDGTCNNLHPDRVKWGAADTVFPRSAAARFRDAETGDPDGPGPAPSGATSYAQKRGIVIDSHPRTVSNLIADQTIGNPAAVAVAGEGAVADDSGTLPIGNVAPDVGLSAPFNGLFTIFGQFFDHGLDLTTKGGGTVMMPLKPDDPLYEEGSPTNFMLLSRATNQPGPDGIAGDRPGTAVDESADDIQDATNTTTAFVDQNQTYTSHPSHQVFLREFTRAAGGPTVDTGRLLGGEGGEGLATWEIVKAEALSKLGIVLEDTDVTNVPLLDTDQYGNFRPGPNGYPQLVTASGLVPGTAAGTEIPADAIRTGHAFLDDIAHHAAPRGDRNPNDGPGPIEDLDPDQDDPAGTTDDGDFTTYDDEMLNAHFVGGDGRLNENIALSAVHHVFHSEHNRLMAELDTMISTTETAANIADWHNSTGPAWEYGQRLFQAARFITEMEYQHLAFEEFARKVQPMVNAFGEGGTGYHTTINPTIRAEFAHAVYRFGHSMLTETVSRTNVDNSSNDLGLIEAFLNPPEYFDGGTAGTLNPDQAAGSVIRGMSRQVGMDIDEFVTEALRNNLLGLPLDLATINMTRARDAGVPPLNHARREFFAESGNSALKPYDSWADFNFNLKHPESLVNFIAAYGTHDTITAETTVAGRRAAAQALVDAAAVANPAPEDQAATEEAFNFINSLGPWATDPGEPTTTGVDDIDLWMGGLAEKPAVFGGMLGSTFNFVFETQMEDLQDGDRFYYLSRTAGLNLLTQLEGNSFAELISRNTDVVNLPADAFSRPDMVFDMGAIGTTGPILDDPATEYNEAVLLTRSNGTVRFAGGEHVAFNGTAGPNRMWSSEGDDTLRGNDGDDWMQGGDGNDNHIGGLGDDIMQDSAGDDTLKGGDGDDALSSGSGFGGDLNQGGRGKDFIAGGNDITETFAGPGDDFVFAGDDLDTVFGDDGDDWIEAGKGPFNLLQGDNGAPFQDDPNEPGHDVLDGDGGEQDYDSEGGDDIMLAGPGIQRSEGMLGFDWVTHKNDPLAADSDMEFTGLLPPGIETNRDRFDLVEGLSGWFRDDILRGDDRADVDLGGATEHQLTQAGIDRIAGLRALLPANTTSFNTGNIILGGAGSDQIEGRGGDDIINGDAWLNTRLSVRTDPADPATEIGSAEGMTRPYLAGSTTTLRQAVFAGTVDPGNIVIVREILSPSGGTDTALFSGPRADYDITFGANGITVTHARGGATDGSDTIRNVEQLRFTDQTVAVLAPAAPTNVVATAGDGSANVSFTPPAANGSPAITGFEILVSDGTLITGIPANATSRTVTRLTNDTPYTFQVRALNAVGSSPLSAPSNSVTPTQPEGALITQRVPGIDATGVALGSNVDVFFDQAMVANGFTTATMVLRNPSGAVVASGVTYSALNRRARLNPNANLAPNTTYTVSLAPSGLTVPRSSLGVPLAPTSWSFTTVAPVAPTVTNTTPAANATNVLRGANIVANFSQAVIGVGNASVVLTNTANNTVVPAVVTAPLPRRAVLNPNAALARNTVYRVNVVGSPTAIRSAATGTPLVSHSWTFTSAP